MHPTRRLGYVTAIVATIVMMAGASAPSPFYPDLAAQLQLPPIGITVVFAVYALTLLLALLVFGSLSDLVGRRPVISVGFVILAVSLFTFWHADSFATLILARAIQGVATGVLMSTLSATVVDFEPPQRPGSAATWNSVSAMLGLAIGALGAGILLDVTPDAKLYTFGALISLYLIVAIVIWFAPDTSPKSGTLRDTVRPRIVAPRAVRPLLMMSVPAVIAGWATGGLFLALVPSLVRVEFGITEHVIQGATIAALAGSGGVAAFVIRNRSARFITNFGTLCLAIGTALSLVALLLGSFWGYIAAVVVVGAGFGTAFGGVLRSVLPAVEPTHRAGTLSTVFIISYLAFGVPSMLAGLSVPVLGLTPTMVTFGSIVVVLAATATVLRVRSEH